MAKNNIVNLALAAVVGSGMMVGANTVLADTHNQANMQNANQAQKQDCRGWPSAKQEKCYGVVKAGMNGCETATHSCAGQAKMDGSSQEWIAVPKGLCEKLVGGSLEPKDN